MHSWSKVCLQACHVICSALICWDHDNLCGLATLATEGLAERAKELHHSEH